MFARPVPLKQNPKVSRGVEAPRGRSRRLMSLSCGDVPYRSMTDFGAKLTSFGRSRRRNPKKISSDARPSFPRPFFSSRRRKINGASRVCSRFSATEKSPGRLIRQLRAGSIPRRGVRRPAERNVLILVRREKRTYYPRFGAASLGNGAETRTLVFWSRPSTRKNPEKQNSDALFFAAPRRALCRDDNTRGCLLVG